MIWHPRKKSHGPNLNFNNEFKDEEIPSINKAFGDENF